MTRNSALAALICAALFAAGCATRSWTEETDTWRAVGPSRTSQENRGIADHWVEVTGPQQDDGFMISERYRTDETGKFTFSLLPAALQCLRYQRDLELVVKRIADGEAVHTVMLTEDEALRVVGNWHAHAKLGAAVRLRPAEIRLLDDLRASERDPDLATMLKDIRGAVTVREEWE